MYVHVRVHIFSATAGTLKDVSKIVEEKFGETKDKELPYSLVLHRDFHGNDTALKQAIRAGDLWQKTNPDPYL
jgi:hypothetical protein